MNERDLQDARDEIPAGVVHPTATAIRDSDGTVVHIFFPTEPGGQTAILLEGADALIWVDDFASAASRLGGFSRIPRDTIAGAVTASPEDLAVHEEMRDEAEARTKSRTRPPRGER